MILIAIVIVIVVVIVIDLYFYLYFDVIDSVIVYDELWLCRLQERMYFITILIVGITISRLTTTFILYFIYDYLLTINTII